MYGSLLTIHIYLEQSQCATDIHLSSLAIQDGSLSRLWPLASILAPEGDEDLMEVDPSVTNEQASTSIIETDQENNGKCYFHDFPKTV